MLNSVFMLKNKHNIEFANIRKKKQLTKFLRINKTEALKVLAL